MSKHTATEEVVHEVLLCTIYLILSDLEGSNEGHIFDGLYHEPSMHTVTKKKGKKPCDSICFYLG